MMLKALLNLGFFFDIFFFNREFGRDGRRQRLGILKFPNRALLALLLSIAYQ